LDYHQALKHLDGLINYEISPRAGSSGGLTLHKMRRVTELLGDPQHAYPSIHITGTNGKGSSGRMIEALLTEMGLRVGLYSSPHVFSPTERIRVAATQIDEADFGSAIGDIARLVAATDLESLTWFETVTAAAFLHFANEAVEVAVIEVGMLGTFDATNVIDASVAVLTNIGLDHTDGSEGWWQSVAKEKAGIVKPGARVIVGEPSLELTELLHAASPAAICAPEVLSNDVAVGGRLVDIKTSRSTYSEVFVSLRGAHQGQNSAVAIAAVEEFFAAPIDPQIVQEALSMVTLPGRMEVVARSPLVLLDAAHNPPGALALGRALREEFGAINRRFLVFGMQTGRDPKEVLEALDVTYFDLIVTCTAPTARGVSARTLSDVARSLNVSSEAIVDVATAMDYALHQAEDHDLVVVAGSVTVLAAARSVVADL